MEITTSSLVRDGDSRARVELQHRMGLALAWVLVFFTCLAALVIGWVVAVEPPFPMLLLSFLATPVLRTIPLVTVALLVVSLMAIFLVRQFGQRKLWLRFFSRSGVLLAVAVIVVSWIRFQTGYTTRPLQINSTNARLVGTLFAPRHLPAPGVLLVHGSGRMDRHLYDWAALLLVRAGYVVLNVDKRGVGESTGDWKDQWQEPSYFQLMIEDHVAAVEALATQREVAGQAIGLWGVSQAGWLIPEVAVQTSAVQFVVTISGPAVPFSDEALFSRLSGDADHFGWKPPLRPLAAIDAIVDTAAPSSGPDPTVALTQMTVPGLWLYGAWDNSIPVTKSVRVLRAQVEMGKPYTVKVYPEANHGLMITRGPNRNMPPEFADGVWETMLQWMRENSSSTRVQTK